MSNRTSNRSRNFARTRRWIAVWLSSVAVLATVAAAAGAEARYRREAVSMHSGWHSAPEEGVEAVFQHVVRVPGARWMRVLLSGYELGAHSFVTFRSFADGSQQRLDQDALRAWGGASAYFNGDAVEVTLHAAAGDGSVALEIREAIVGTDGPGDAAGLEGTRSLCAFADDRVSSSHDAVARLIDLTAGGTLLSLCTAWLASNGAVVTAGHCVDGDPDNFGPAVPDGVLDLDVFDLLEFDVPPSDPNGVPAFAHADDQHPIDLSSVDWEFPGYVVSVFGGDWAVMRAGPNGTGRTPQQNQGAFFRMTNEDVPLLSTIRVTGYGTDSTPPGPAGGTNSSAFTQQTATGPYGGEFTSVFGLYHLYEVDMEGGSSGGPVIWTDEGFTIGINVASGCPVFPNSGTSFEHDPVEDALQAFPGANTVYVDAVDHPGATENGTVFHPHETIATGIASASSGAILSVVTGSYGEALVIDQSVTLVAPVGSVVIGQ